MDHCTLDYKRKALADTNVRFLEMRVSMASAQLGVFLADSHPG